MITANDAEGQRTVVSMVGCLQAAESAVREEEEN